MIIQAEAQVLLKNELLDCTLYKTSNLSSRKQCSSEVHTIFEKDYCFLKSLCQGQL